MALVQIGASSKVRSVGSAKDARLFAKGSDLTVGVTGRALALERAAGTSVATTKTEGTLMYGLLARAGALVVDGASITRLVLDGARIVVGAKREVSASITCVHASRDGEIVAVGTRDGHIHLFSADEAAPFGTARVSATAAVAQLALHADGVRVLSLCGGTARWEDVSSGASSPVAHPEERAWAGLTCHPSEPWAALVDEGGDVYLAHADTSALQRVGRHHIGTHRLVLVDEALFVGGGVRAPDAPPASVVR